MDRRDQTSSRKLDHLRICLERNIERGDPGFGDVRLVHNALPECDLEFIDTGIEFLGHSFDAPLFIASMTGGHPDTREVNRRLAGAADRAGIGIGVGSQRAALERPELADTFSVVREAAPRAFIAANIGAVQLRDYGLEWADRAIDMIDADAITVHLNFLQEALQPEGDHDARKCLPAIEELCRQSRVPVIIKETGSGISAATARQCWEAGVGAIDVGGWGGTNWAAIEGLRTTNTNSPPGGGRGSISRIFEDWGIPTVVSLCEVAKTGGPVIATGGIRSGIDMAKAIALSADLCGVALPLLAPAMQGEEQVSETIAAYVEELRIAMFLSGARNLGTLREKRPYVIGRTRQMLQSLEENNGY
ncbi:MAG TPA: type 2 isopentenyl-diphosphate Delta-isomerase [Methanoregulaceae archaeon]|nr:MAG: type 2 isopentenyl-diphosphate Delta-isomerase [Methanolinea sp.]HON81187.1 type 2 isopentenyl-diphosphate Delta-isomerase [Methanoregulaceae archaeon]HPD09869.1 type 2 isopentenyl-diphosphate Delta-isomerase [Methanoregulaceae archaeon]HRT14940.1 type 2 isopentenyl-diphosphate Delta-isomerase [Methanoregulaceae archaeon]HRU30445.1 type 2 isopentenyl-diphosphate Delta-isomerase [Methanoregulaceae archaeon]